MLCQSLQEGVRPFLTVTSNSMFPLIRRGDEIQLAQADQNELDLGDIIVVEDDGGFLAHRYWSSFSSDGDNYLVLRGDRLKTFDPPYSASQFIGRVVARRRNNLILDLSHGIGRQLNTQLGRIAALTVPPPSPPSIEPTASLVRDHQRKKQSNRFIRRALNRVLYFTSQLLTLATDLLIRFR